ncbi:hypothetical protein [Ectothiorhodospira lacustris]|uniref:hypothetical protein n=1 Tax=Ectothiorhodospira lacustris TaxID=2899127 RepID=UPI001EE98D23|nr:hypothetical protein [Ectothiorhodospira lacustris]MCG5501143.1 hypothetical protein [Ectothiorhodospira lacustris]
MELTAIHQTFDHWVAQLQQQGLPARLSSRLDAIDPTLTVAATLLGIAPEPRRRAQASPRRRGMVRPVARAGYLVSVGGDDDRQTAHALLQLLAWAELEPDFTVSDASPAPVWWLAQGARPRPGFQLEACITCHEDFQAAPPVRVREVHLQTRN